MSIKNLINKLIFEQNYEDLLTFYENNDYFRYKLQLLLKINEGLLNNIEVNKLALPSTNFTRINKIKFKSGGSDKDEYFPNYRIFKLIDLIEEKGVDKEEVKQKYNDLQIYYKELFNAKFSNEDFVENTLKLEYNKFEKRLGDVQDKTTKFLDKTKNNVSTKVKLSILLENLDNYDRRNLIFKETEISEIEDILDKYIEVQK